MPASQVARLRDLATTFFYTSVNFIKAKSVSLTLLHKLNAQICCTWKIQSIVKWGMFWAGNFEKQRGHLLSPWLVSPKT